MISTPSIPAEAQFLFRIAGPGGVRAPLPDSRDASFRWKRLFRLAGRERALPLLHRCLEAHGFRGVPGAEAARLRHLALLSEFRMRYLMERLQEALEALADAGIPVVLLKGAALAATADSSFARREMTDLDLLVPRERAGEAWQRLLGLEWRRALDERFEPFYQEHHHLCPLQDARGTGLCLEVHSALFPDGNPFDLAVDQIWTEARAVEVGGRPALVPGHAHMALHLCTHFAWSHQMGSGAWRTFFDLATLHAEGCIDWRELVSLARRTRAASCCYWTLRLARTMTGLPVPDAVLADLAPPVPDRVRTMLERYLLSVLHPPAEWDVPVLRLRNLLWETAIQPGWSGHGEVRPWHRSRDFIANAGAASPRVEPAPAGAPGPPRAVARLRQLLREVGTLLHA